MSLWQGLKIHESVTHTSIDMLTLTQVSDSEVERFFARLDVNNDGEVSRQEFISWHHGRFAAAAQEEELVLEQLQNLEDCEFMISLHTT